jgi:hypothetical protein
LSYFIDEGLGDAKAKLSALEAVSKKFPDAQLGRLPDGSRVWTASGVVPEDFCVVVAGERGYLCPFVMVESIAVFQANHFVDAAVAFHDIKKTQPSLMRALLGLIMGR